VARLRNVNRDELYAVADSQQGRDAVKRAADAVASNARRRAPKDTGAGAASIQAVAHGQEFRVSWDAAHDYMQFVELGTRKRSARPFLRPAVTDVKGGQ
jgi:HK97 gp10 family phage protein